jgi:hypothetical protein
MGLLMSQKGRSKVDHGRRSEVGQRSRRNQGKSRKEVMWVRDEPVTIIVQERVKARRWVVGEEER